LSPAHQNPAKAPPQPIDFEHSKYSTDNSSCNIASSPSCAKGSGSTNGQTIGYYQSSRKCDTKTPNQLDTRGFTHLFYPFAFIDSTSFKITPAHDDDIEQMREFTGISKDSDLKTRIAIGGFDMSDTEAPANTTWSDMVSTKVNRAAFIESVRDYMDEYGFTGVDLDWQYPGEPKCGGRKLADTHNFALLLKEMRAAYGDKYGISLALAADYWYLRWFDAKAMEPYVDFFGFMDYGKLISNIFHPFFIANMLRPRSSWSLGRGYQNFWKDHSRPRRYSRYRQ
jgi:chitinase